MNRDRSSEDIAADNVPRRGFFTKATAVFVGGVVGLVPALASIGFLFHPLIRRDTGTAPEEDGFIPLGISPDALPADGTPQSVKVVADKVDAWNYFPDQEIGSVWLRRMPNDQVIAFNTICPHLGCSIDYRGAQKDFFCPCHFSSFGLDGEKQNSIPPRDMDSLPVKIGEDGNIWVDFQNFRGACEEKIPV